MQHCGVNCINSVQLSLLFVICLFHFPLRSSSGTFRVRVFGERGPGTSGHSCALRASRCSLFNFCGRGPEAGTRGRPGLARRPLFLPPGEDSRFVSAARLGLLVQLFENSASYAGRLSSHLISETLNSSGAPVLEPHSSGKAIWKRNHVLPPERM